MKVMLDIETMGNNSNAAIVAIGTYHNAVDDAESQALHLIKILKSKY